MLMLFYAAFIQISLFCQFCHHHQENVLWQRIHFQMKKNQDCFYFDFSATISSVLWRPSQGFHSVTKNEQRNLSIPNLAPTSNLHLANSLRIWLFAQSFLKKSFHFLWVRGSFLYRKSISMRNRGNRLKAQLLEMSSFMITQAFVGISFSSVDHSIKHFTKEMFHRRFTLRNRI